MEERSDDKEVEGDLIGRFPISQPIPQTKQTNNNNSLGTSDNINLVIDKPANVPKEETSTSTISLDPLPVPSLDPSPDPISDQYSLL